MPSQQGRNHLSIIIDGHGCVTIHRVAHGAESRWEIGRSTLAHVCEDTRVDIYLERCLLGLPPRDRIASRATRVILWHPCQKRAHTSS